MTVIRPLIMCGCTADTSKTCAQKGWNGGGCRCPCHYSQEQIERLVGAYITLNTPIVGWIKKRLSVKTPQLSIPTVAYRCGHEHISDTKLSVTARQWIQQNVCEECQRAEPPDIYSHAEKQSTIADDGVPF